VPALCLLELNVCSCSNSFSSKWFAAIREALSSPHPDKDVTNKIKLHGLISGGRLCLRQATESSDPIYFQLEYSWSFCGFNMTKRQSTLRILWFAARIICWEHYSTGSVATPISRPPPPLHLTYFYGDFSLNSNNPQSVENWNTLLNRLLPALVTSHHRTGHAKAGGRLSRGRSWIFSASSVKLICKFAQINVRN
jgi:hypothetical protein